jgi:hypothetical protein
MALATAVPDQPSRYGPKVLDDGVTGVAGFLLRNGLTCRSSRRGVRVHSRLLGEVRGHAGAWSLDGRGDDAVHREVGDAV